MVDESIYPDSIEEANSNSGNVDSGTSAGGGGGDDDDDDDRSILDQILGGVEDTIDDAASDAEEIADQVREEVQDQNRQQNANDDDGGSGQNTTPGGQSSDSRGRGQTGQTGTDGTEQSRQEQIDDAIADSNVEGSERVDDPDQPNDEEEGQRATAGQQKTGKGPFPDSGPAGSNPNVAPGDVNLPDGNGDLTDELADGNLTRSEVVAETEDVETPGATGAREEELQGPLGEDPARQDEPGVELEDGEVARQARDLEEQIIGESPALGSRQDLRIVREDGQLQPLLTDEGRDAVVEEIVAETDLREPDVDVSERGEVTVTDLGASLAGGVQTSGESPVQGLSEGTLTALGEIRQQEAQEEARSRARQKARGGVLEKYPALDAGEDFTISTSEEDGQVTASVQLTAEGREQLARDQIAAETNLDPGEEFRVDADQQDAVDQAILGAAEQAPTGVDDFARLFASDGEGVNVTITDEGRIELAGRQRGGQTALDSALSDAEQAVGVNLPGEGDLVQQIEAELRQASAVQRAGRGVIPSDEQVESSANRLPELSAPGFGGYNPEQTAGFLKAANLNPGGIILSSGQITEDVGESAFDTAVASPLGLGAFLGAQERQAASGRLEEDVAVAGQRGSELVEAGVESVEERPEETSGALGAFVLGEVAANAASGALIRRAARRSDAVEDLARVLPDYDPFRNLGADGDLGEARTVSRDQGSPEPDTVGAEGGGGLPPAGAARVAEEAADLESGLLRYFEDFRSDESARLGGGRGRRRSRTRDTSTDSGGRTITEEDIVDENFGGEPSRRGRLVDPDQSGRRQQRRAGGGNEFDSGDRDGGADRRRERGQQREVRVDDEVEVGGSSFTGFGIAGAVTAGAIGRLQAAQQPAVGYFPSELGGELLGASIGIGSDAGVGADILEDTDTATAADTRTRTDAALRLDTRTLTVLDQALRTDQRAEQRSRVDRREDTRTPEPDSPRTPEGGGRQFTPDFTPDQNPPRPPRGDDEPTPFELVFSEDDQGFGDPGSGDQGPATNYVSEQIAALAGVSTAPDTGDAAGLLGEIGVEGQDTEAFQETVALLTSGAFGGQDESGFELGFDLDGDGDDELISLEV